MSFQQIPSDSLANQSIITAVPGTLSSPAATLSGYWKLDQKLTGDITGNAATATKLSPSAKINGTKFDGTADITITAVVGNAVTFGSGLKSVLTSDGTTSQTTYDGSSAVTVSLPTTGVAAGTYNSVSVDVYGRVTAATTQAVGSGTVGSSTASYVAYYAVTGAAVTGSANLTFDGTNLTCQGNITAYSDSRLKSNVETITSALEKTKSLRGVTFDRIADGRKGLGVIAQEVQAVIPEVVLEHADGMLSVDYGNIVGLLIESIKELESKVVSLEQQLAGRE